MFSIAALALLGIAANVVLSSCTGATSLVPWAAGDHRAARAGFLLVALVLIASGGAHWWLTRRAAHRSAATSADLQRDIDTLRASERRYRESFERAIVGLLRVSADGLIHDVNPALLRMLGYEAAGDLIGRNVVTLYRNPDDRRRIVEDVGTQSEIAGVAIDWQRRDGTPLTVRVSSRVSRDADGRLTGFDDVIEDVTERVAIGEQLRNAQKMDAVGRLAGGIAHDFNNLLTVIMGNTELLAGDMGLSPHALESVEQIRAAAGSAATVTRQLLMFSRKGATSPQAIDVNATVSSVEKMLARLIGEDIRVFSNLMPGAGRVLVDPAHFEQALINLAVNARDAMPRGGVLIFETMAFDHARRIRVSVRDSGQGMDETTRQRAFEPFFTTKPPGRGAGLGLSMVYGFAQQSGGTTTITSIPGRGTTVTMEFPTVAADGVASDLLVPARGSERVLVVEDQDSVRSLITGVLAQRGFRVFPAADVRQARRVLAAEPDVDLVLTDVVMPGESGLDLAEWLRTAYPRVRVSFMSGYTDHPAIGSVPPQRLLHKPFTASGLLMHVRRALDDRPDSAQTPPLTRASA